MYSQLHNSGTKSNLDKNKTVTAFFCVLLTKKLSIRINPLLLIISYLNPVFLNSFINLTLEASGAS